MTADSAKPKKGTSCPKCGNRLRVRPDQKGEQVRCPKCNATFVVGRPPKPAPEPVSPDAPYEPEIPLKKATIVPEEPLLLESSAQSQSIIHEEPGQLELGDEAPDIVPMQAPITSHLPRYAAAGSTDELEMEAVHQRPRDDQPDYLAIAHERGLMRDDNLQPIPNWTFFSGVFTFPWQVENLARWGTMTIGLTATGYLLALVVMGLAGGVTLSTLTMPLLTIILVAASLVTLAFCSACFLAAVDDTADGHDQPQEGTFPPLDQWIFSFFSVLGIWLMSGALGYPLTLVPAVGPPAILVSSLVLFPILLLSAMECDSFFLPLSPNVWKTLLHFPGSWLAFYVLSTALLAAWYLLVVAAIEPVGLYAVLLAGPALAGVMLIYARLVGRLAWRITFIPSGAKRGKPARQEPKQPVAAGSKGKKRKKVRTLKLQLPDELDRPSVGADDGPRPPRAKLDFHKRP